MENIFYLAFLCLLTVLCESYSSHIHEILREIYLRKILLMLNLGGHLHVDLDVGNFKKVLEHCKIWFVSQEKLIASS